MPHNMMLGRGMTALALGSALGLAACGGGTSPESDTSPAATSEAVASGEMIEITGESYAFEGVPETVDMGTRLTFSNASDDEPHELVLVRLHDDAPPVEEFVSLPREEGEQVSDFIGVSMAMPSEDGRVLDGDLVVEEPGTYVLLCALPVGVTPEFIQENPEGPPPSIPEEFGPPHLTQGMFASFAVED